MRQPPLILGSELTGTVNATHAKHHCRQPVDATVVPHILVPRSFRTTIWRMKIQRLGLGNPLGKIAIGVALGPFRDSHFFHTSIHFVGGSKDEGRTPSAEPCTLQHIQSSQSVDLKIGSRIIDGCRHRDLPGEVIDHVRVLGGCPGIVRVSDISMNESERAIEILAMEPSQVLLTAATRQRIKNFNSVSVS